jgi:imidazolonepropionase-like amidohydrolase
MHAHRWLALLFVFISIHHLQSQEKPKSIPAAPPRAEGDGPFQRLILRGGTLIDGTGAPPVGPVDIIIEGNRITRIRSVGFPGVPIDPEGRPESKEGDKELDIEGMYVLPGFIDMHGHVGGVEQGTPAEYVFKLWMGHGITTVRDPGSGNGLDWTLEHKIKSAKNDITAPRIEAYAYFGLGHDGPIRTPDEARKWVADVARKGADGLKIFALSPELMTATLDEAKKLGLRAASHHPQLSVARMNALQTARLGLTTMEHWYGLPEALFVEQTVQNFPLDYNYNDEYHRFSAAGRLWKQAAPPFSEKWNAVMNELLALDFTIDPTFTIYEAARDFDRVRRDEWHDEYTLPSVWEFFRPNRKAHGSFWFNWTTQDEIEWKNNFRLWMAFINEFKNRGGRVTCGSDAGYIYKIYGFGYIRELELLQEAGFHPLEVIRSATLYGAQALGLEKEIGTVEIGKLADLVVVEENPLQNLKVLYGTGAIQVNEKNEVVRVGGVKYTIKDGIIYDAKKLLADVRRMVREAKEQAGITRLSSP